MTKRKDVDKFNQLLGAKLQQLRMDQGVKQETVASELNVTKSYISKIENGRLIIAAGILVKYCAIIGVACNEVLEELTTIFL